MNSRHLLGLAVLLCTGCGQTWQFTPAVGVSPRYVALSCSREGEADATHELVLAEDYERGNGSDLWSVHGYEPEEGDICELTLVTQQRSCAYPVEPTCKEGEDCVVSIRGCQ